MEQLRWLGKCMLGRRKWFFTALGMAVFSAALYVTFPFLTQKITDTVLSQSGSQAAQAVMGVILPLLALLLAAQGLRTLLRFIMTLILEFVSQGVQTEIRIQLYDNLHKQDADFYMHHRTGDLMTRLTGDLDMVRHTVAWISYQATESVALFVFSLVYLFSVNAALTGLLLLFVPVILVGSFVYTRLVYPLYGKLHDRLSHLNSLVQENIEGNKTVRAFVREEHEFNNFSAANAGFREANLKANQQWNRFFPVIEISSQAMGLVVLLVGGLLIVQGNLSFGELMAFTLLTRGLSDPMRNLGMYLNDFQRFLASSAKVMEVYYGRPGIQNPEEGVTAAGNAGDIVFDHVTVRYPGQKMDALRDLSFTVRQGQTIAVLGTTGSGKTTMVEAITRMLDVKSGKVLVGGVDVRKWNLQALRSRIAVATQRVQLHSDTIAANVAFSNPEMDEQTLRKYLALAEADFVSELPQGLNTIIGEQGTGLSGGQKQRIALARAMAKQAEVLILDDVTSAVDLGTERKLVQNMRSLPPCTKIIIAQRISSVRHADCIYVLEQGRIIQQGTNAELLAQDGAYKNLCQLQGLMQQEAM